MKSRARKQTSTPRDGELKKISPYDSYVAPHEK